MQWHCVTVVLEDIQLAKFVPWGQCLNASGVWQTAEPLWNQTDLKLYYLREGSKSMQDKHTSIKTKREEVLDFGRIMIQKFPQGKGRYLLTPDAGFLVLTHQYEVRVGVSYLV